MVSGLWGHRAWVRLGSDGGDWHRYPRRLRARAAGGGRADWYDGVYGPMSASAPRKERPMTDEADAALHAWAREYPGTFEGFTVGAWDGLRAVLMERERLALERAADMLQAKAQSLYDWGGK
jgi:hypothetical protein